MCESTGSTDGGGAPASREEAARIIAANDEASFWRLRGVPGYQLDPVPWARVVRLVAEGTEAAFGQLGRSPAALVRYHRFKLSVQMGYVSLADYVQFKVFGFDTKDFPYHLDPDVEHHNVWSTKPLPEAELHAVVRSNRAGYEWVAFINPAPIQTIPSVWHAHIISRPVRRGSKEGNVLAA